MASRDSETRFHTPRSFSCSFWQVLSFFHTCSFCSGVASPTRRSTSRRDLLVENTVAVNSLLTTDGIRFMFTSMIRNFMGFGPVGVILVAMIGVGLAEQAGLITALIKKIVSVAPAWSLTYIIVLVGVLSSIAADAGYLVLIPPGCGRFPHGWPAPARRDRCRLRGRCRRLPGQRLHRASRRYPDRDHQ